MGKFIKTVCVRLKLKSSLTRQHDFDILLSLFLKISSPFPLKVYHLLEERGEQRTIKVNKGESSHTKFFVYFLVYISFSPYSSFTQCIFPISPLCYSLQGNFKVNACELRANTIEVSWGPRDFLLKNGLTNWKTQTTRETEKKESLQ